MHREGHIGVALLVYAPLALIAAAVGYREAALLGGLAMAGLAMVPDLDMQVPFVPHRGPTHTVHFAGLTAFVGAAAGLLVGLPQGLLAGLGFGLFGGVIGGLSILAHIFADALTPMGVAPFALFGGKTYSYDLARASNPIANYGLLGLGGAGSLGALVLGTKIHSMLGV